MFDQPRRWFILPLLLLTLASMGIAPLLAAGTLPGSDADWQQFALAASPPAATLSATERAFAPEAQRQPLMPAVTVRVADVPQVAYAGIYLALARGYFQQEGLDVRLEPFT